MQALGLVEISKNAKSTVSKTEDSLDVTLMQLRGKLFGAR